MNHEPFVPSSIHPLLQEGSAWVGVVADTAGSAEPAPYLDYKSYCTLISFSLRSVGWCDLYGAVSCRAQAVEAASGLFVHLDKPTNLGNALNIWR